jgi:hypothetical protein
MNSAAPSEARSVSQEDCRTTTGQSQDNQQSSNKPPTHKSWLNFNVFAQSPQGSGRVEAKGVLRSVLFSVWVCSGRENGIRVSIAESRNGFI